MVEVQIWKSNFNEVLKIFFIDEMSYFAITDKLKFLLIILTNINSIWIQSMC